MSKCEWIIDQETGDMIMRCHDSKEKARVPRAIIDATTSTFDHTNIVIEKLKSNVEKSLNCKTREASNDWLLFFF